MLRARPSHRLASAAAVVAATGAALLAGSSPAAAATCSDVDVVFARGTGETPGLGVVGGPFVRSLTGELSDRTVTSHAVDYAASSSQASAGPGATAMSAHVREVAAACPSTRFVLGGYSQGATVTDIALGIRTGTTTGTPVPAELAGRVAAVVVFGNPLGLSGRTIATASSTYGPKSKDYCNSSDSVCGSAPKTGTGGHLSYASNGSTTDGARFAAGLVRAAGTPTTPTPTPTPTPVPTTCVRDSTRDHVAADRAVSLYGRAYARGSRDSLGATSSYNVVSLQQVEGGWRLVTAC
ncbi:cutinase [Kineococcus radiotolerans]|uniref:Cutinase n=2 Tax=Kineococcus radiotolerans TaxID=131568 RepID=CUTI_KINRD|nr:cutinase [Kineococcus radiotolerans]A6WFI5.1 RecName: Full=Cutinase; AltName: Full=KrCUT; Flags: Precursor [Kineococcus radiotolerans SRS30216 = ATCC BAA-149]ABS05574.1 cutinase [Kineococcus radiotolerans SRS30216 = ATCC BAA-149]MBB2902456.1 cutinase [Kineococcus radiotolerans]